MRGKSPDHIAFTPKHSFIGLLDVTRTAVWSGFEFRRVANYVSGPISMAETQSAKSSSGQTSTDGLASPFAKPEFLSRFDLVHHFFLKGHFMNLLVHLIYRCRMEVLDSRWTERDCSEEFPPRLELCRGDSGTIGQVTLGERVPV